MSTTRRPSAQWTLDVTIYHDPGFQHRIRAMVLGRKGGWQEVGTWEWRGLGIDASLASDIEARIASVIAEHLVTRYGIQGQLRTTWAGEPESS